MLPDSWPLGLLDIGILLFWLRAAWKGYEKGLIHESIDLLKWVLALFLVWRHTLTVAARLEPYYNADETVRMLIAAILIVVGVLCVGWAAKTVLGYFVSYSPLRPLDQGFGALLGWARSNLIVFAVISGLSLTGATQSAIWQRSELAPRILPMAQMWLAWYPDVLREQLNLP